MFQGSIFSSALGSTVISWIPGTFSADIDLHLDDMMNEVYSTHGGSTFSRMRLLVQLLWGKAFEVSRALRTIPFDSLYSANNRHLHNSTQYYLPAAFRKVRLELAVEGLAGQNVGSAQLAVLISSGRHACPPPVPNWAGRYKFLVTRRDP